LRITKFCECLL